MTAIRGGRLRTGVYYAVVLAALAVLAVIAIAIGSTPLPWPTVVRVLASKCLPAGWIDVSGLTNADVAIVWLIRLPRVIVAAFVGAGLATAGAMMQGLFRNPLAEPSMTGVGPGAVLGAVAVFVTGAASASVVALPLVAIGAALAAQFLVYGIATRGGATPITTLLLSGIAVGSFLTAISSMLISLNIANWQATQEILFWMSGGLDSRTWAHVWLSVPFVTLGVIAAVLQARTLDLLLLGEDTAASLGVDVEGAKRLLVLTAAILTGGSVAVAGLIGFVGLIVPHAVRLLLGPSHRTLLAASAVTGAVFVIGCDLIARTIRPPAEIRLGVVTALFGAPFFLLLLVRRLREAHE